MPTYRRDDFDEDEAFESDNGDLIPCPHCRKPIHDDSEQCPHCRMWLSREDAPAEGKPWWIVAGVIACLVVVYFWLKPP